MKRFIKCSDEIVSIVLGVVVIGVLALAATGTFLNQTNSSLNKGMTQQTTTFGTNYKTAATEQTASAPIFQ